MQPLAQGIGLAVLAMVAVTAATLVVLAATPVTVGMGNLTETVLLVLVAAAALAQIITMVAQLDFTAALAVLVFTALVVMVLVERVVEALLSVVVAAAQGELAEHQPQSVRLALVVTTAGLLDGFVTARLHRAHRAYPQSVLSGLAALVEHHLSLQPT